MPLDNTGDSTGITDNSNAQPASFTVDDQPQQLPRTVGIWSACGLVVGVIVGSGIFSSPSVILYYAGSPTAALLVWLMTGLLAMAGALTYAELGTLIRQSGGEQAYLREIYGELWSFQFIWFSAMVGKPASMAIVLTVIAEYWLMLGLPHHLQPLPSTLRAVMTKSLALGLLAALLLMQIFSPKSGERLQNATSGLKLILLFCISFCGAIVVVGRLLSGTIASATSTVSIPIENEGYSGNRVQAIILACYQGLWAYDGWNNLNIITGELIDPDRSLPRTIIVSIPLITVLYLAVNISYLAVLPTQTFRQSTTVAIDFAQEFFRQLMTPTAGQLAGTLFGMLVTIGTVGSCCVGLFIAGRLMHSAALKNQLPYAAYFARLEAVSLRQTVDEPQPSNQVPVRGLFFQSLLTVLFLLTGTYQSLIQLYSWMVWVFYGLSALGVILLRYREPFRSQPRPFKVLIVLPYVFFLTSCLLVIVPLIIEPVNVISGLGMFVAGIPVYYSVVKNMSIGEMWRSMSEWLVRFRQRHAYQQMDTQYHQNISARSAVPIDAHLMEMQVIHAIGSDSESER